MVGIEGENEEAKGEEDGEEEVGLSEDWVGVEDRVGMEVGLSGLGVFGDGVDIFFIFDGGFRVGVWWG